MLDDCQLPVKLYQLKISAKKAEAENIHNYI